VIDRKSIQQLVIADLTSREAHGIAEYGNALFVDTPDDADGPPLQQAYHEVLDLAIYLRWELEREKQRQASNGQR
jgi:hypothetical protein